MTIPSLEIDQPDVRRASHASSVAPIDESQVFYAMTRGLSQDEARKAITLAFLEPVVARIPLPDVQERLRGLAGEASTLNLEQFAELNRSEFDRYGKLVKAANIKAE